MGSRAGQSEVGRLVKDVVYVELREKILQSKKVVVVLVGIKNYQEREKVVVGWIDSAYYEIRKEKVMSHAKSGRRPCIIQVALAAASFASVSRQPRVNRVLLQPTRC
jgi:hypothetical protein